MSIMQNFGTYKEQTKPMIEQGFILEKPQKDINQTNFMQTRYYRELARDK
jgi:hypothetical protein